MFNMPCQHCVFYTNVMKIYPFADLFGHKTFSEFAFNQHKHVYKYDSREAAVYDISQVKYWFDTESPKDRSGNKYKRVCLKQRAVYALISSISGAIVVRMQEATVYASIVCYKNLFMLTCTPYFYTSISHLVL
jgi:hypothetical protein